MSKKHKSKDEYLMLRKEILHLDSITNNTINFFYAFISAYIAFAMKQEDTIFVLLSFIGIIPPYLIVINKMDALCRIAAYLNVFQEGGNFNWERRYIRYKEKYESSKFRIISWHTPFILTSLAVTILFFYKTNWQNISIIDTIKCLICLTLLLWILCKACKNRNISPIKYIKRWEKVIDNKIE